VTIPIDDETHPEESRRSPEEVEQGNPGKPQSDYEPQEPESLGDEPPDGADNQVR
jgi:hypothetical protein